MHYTFSVALRIAPRQVSISIKCRRENGPRTYDRRAWLVEFRILGISDLYVHGCLSVCMPKSNDSSESVTVRFQL